jgi:hypothetical protein
VSTTGQPAHYSQTVHQAAAMITLQVNCRIEQAFSLLLESAVVANVTVEQLAVAVLNRSIRFN